MKVSLDMASAVMKEEIYNERILLKPLKATLFHIYQCKTVVGLYIQKGHKCLRHSQCDLVA